MSWFYERFTRQSEKNGLIDCRRVFGTWTVWVDGYSQTGDFNTRMFVDALKRLPANSSVKRALVLGLGGGCAIELLHDRFPGVDVTAIEWDPMMVEIAERIHLFSPSHAPHILVGDALEVLPTLTQPFDLIVFDLYTGQDISPLVFLAPFLFALKHVSHSKTLLLMNAFRSKELFPLLDDKFERLEQWRFEYNLLGLYRSSKS